MLDREAIATRVSEIRRRRSFLEDFIDIAYEDFVPSGPLDRATEYYAALNHIQIALQACIDIAKHIIAVKNFERPKEIRNSFTILSRHKILSKELAEKFAKATSVRNILVHSYTDVERCPSLVEKGNRKVVLLDSKCAAVKQFSVEDLRVKDIFDLKEGEILKTWFMLHSGHSLIQDSRGNFYFLVSNTYFRGAQNCTYVLYKYDPRKDALDIITDDIFGISVRLYMSPNEKRIALVRSAHASVCDERSYLELIDLASRKKVPVNKFQDPELEVMHIENLKWFSDQKLEILTTHSAGCNPAVGTVRKKRFLYDTKTGEVKWELLREYDASHG